MGADAGVAVEAKFALGNLELDLDAASSARAIAIAGPSGAGKSSCLKLLAGLLRPPVGRVVVRGETWLDAARGRFVPPWRRGVGWAPQEALLFPHASVAENLAWSGVAPSEVARVADLLAIAPLLARRPRHLSGGERQRVALGRALLRRPALLLLDEPFAALDRSLRARITDATVALAREAGSVLLIVSHDERDLAVADEVWTMERGRLRAG